MWACHALTGSRLPATIAFGFSLLGTYHARKMPIPSRMPPREAISSLRESLEGCMRGAPYRASEGEAAVRERLAQGGAGARVLVEPEGAVGQRALVVEGHPHPRVAPDPAEEPGDEPGVVGAPQRPFAERERLAGEVAVEVLEPVEVREAAVEVRADPVHVGPAGPVGARHVGGDVGRPARLRDPYHRDARAGSSWASVCTPGSPSPRSLASMSATGPPRRIRVERRQACLNAAVECAG